MFFCSRKVVLSLRNILAKCTKKLSKQEKTKNCLYTSLTTTITGLLWMPGAGSANRKRKSSPEKPDPRKIQERSRIECNAARNQEAKESPRHPQQPPHQVASDDSNSSDDIIFDGVSSFFTTFYKTVLKIFGKKNFLTEKNWGASWKMLIFWIKTKWKKSYFLCKRFTRPDFIIMSPFA